jgi:hypothetical protein
MQGTGSGEEIKLGTFGRDALLEVFEVYMPFGDPLPGVGVQLHGIGLHVSLSISDVHGSLKAQQVKGRAAL